MIETINNLADAFVVQAVALTVVIIGVTTIYELKRIVRQFGGRQTRLEHEIGTVCVWLTIVVAIAAVVVIIGSGYTVGVLKPEQ